MRATLGSVAAVRVLTTAAAYRGAAAAFAEVVATGLFSDAALASVDALDRRSAQDPGVVAEVTGADLVVLVEGAALHARSVWRGTALGQALATVNVLAVGSVASVLGVTMIDPRGGAPTTGLGLFGDVVLTLKTGVAQDERTQSLVGAVDTLVELGPLSVVAYDGRWRVVSDEGLVLSRAGQATTL